MKRTRLAFQVAFGLLVGHQSVMAQLPADRQEPKQLYVLLLAGQSNADGRASGSELPSSLQAPQPTVPFYFYTHGMAANPDGTVGRLTTLRPGCTQMPPGGFGPEVTLGCDLAQAVERIQGAKLAIIKFAKGGSNLGMDWSPQVNITNHAAGIYYRTFQQVVKDGLAALHRQYPRSRIQLLGMVWVQGESDIDAGSRLSATYGVNLAEFINDLRIKVSPKLPFYFSRISSRQTIYSTPGSKLYTDYLLVRAGQEQVAATVDNVGMIDTDGPAFSTKADHLHFDARGQQALGSAFASRIAEHLELPSYQTAEMAR